MGKGKEKIKQNKKSLPPGGGLQIREELVSKIGTHRLIYLYELIFLLGMISKSKKNFLLFHGKDLM